MKTMKILNKGFLLALIITLIGCSTDDVEIYSAESNNVEVENVIASKVIEEVIVDCAYHEMKFHDSFNTTEIKADIISYYSNNSGITITPYGSLGSVSYGFTWDEYSGLMYEKFKSDKRFIRMSTYCGPNDDEDQFPVLW